MRPAAWILILAATWPAFAAADQGSGQAVLSELWQRRVLSPDKDQAAPADLMLLARMHRVESDDAVGFLREKLHGLRGLAVLSRDAKTRQTHWRLTKEGFDKYLFLRTQDALAYLEAHGVGYKWAFQARDMQGAPLFDQTGLLTDDGQTVYDKLLADAPVHYQLPDGTIAGNRAPPAPPAPAEPAPEPAHAFVQRPATQPPPEAEPQPEQQQPDSAQQPPPDQAPAGTNGQAATPDAQQPQSASAPPPDDQAPAPDPGPAPSDSD